MSKSDSESESSSDSQLQDEADSIPLEELLEFCEQNGLQIEQDKKIQVKDEPFRNESENSYNQLAEVVPTTIVEAIYGHSELKPTINFPFNENSITVVPECDVEEPDYDDNALYCDLESYQAYDDTFQSSVGTADENQSLDPSDEQLLQNSPQLTESNASHLETLPETRRGKFISPTSREKRKKGWKRVSNMAKRMRGETYVGFDTVRDPNTQKKHTHQIVPRNARSMKPTCQTTYCQRSQLRHCSTISGEVRQKIYDDFWKRMDWGEKKAHVRSLVDHIKIKRNERLSSRRNRSFIYFLQCEGRKKQVCQQIFLGTLGLGKDQVHGWLSGKAGTKKRNVSELKTQSPYDGDRVFYKTFLDTIQKIPSHYCREKTSKEFLEPYFRTKKDVYNAYKGECVVRNIKPTSTWSFNVYFHEKNYALHQPKKDMCDTCSSFEVGNVSQEEYDDHLEKKKSARKEKSKDKSLAIEGKAHAITMDVQKVLLSPMLNASALYYKTKLVVHNFTVYDLATNDVVCYLFDETEAELVASTFASCLTRFFEEKYKDDLPIMIFSDGCTSQNRNAYLSSALLHYSCKTQKVIIQKYLEKGHTQMECDSVHSKIEKNIKGKSIYLPTDYIEICKGARQNPRPFEVQYLHHEDFLDFSKFKCNIRPGNKTGDPVVTDLRQLKYNPDGTIHYKLNHLNNWTTMPRSYKIDSKFSFPKLYSNKLPINKRKYQDLQDLLPVIPKRHHEFYKTLPRSPR